jgi:hypothetical protein
VVTVFMERDQFAQLSRAILRRFAHRYLRVSL